MPDSALGAAESPTAASQGNFGSQQTDSTEEPQLASLTGACPSMPSITSVPAAAPYASATVPCRVRAATSHEATFVLKSNSFCVSENQHVAVRETHPQHHQVCPIQQHHTLSDTTWDACYDRNYTADH